MVNQKNTPLNLFVRTQYDGREYISVLEVFFYDDEGKEVIYKSATKSCFALVTCGDMSEKYDVLKHQVETNLKKEGIKYLSVTMVDAD